MSRRKLRRELEDTLDLYIKLSDLPSVKDDDMALFYLGASWAVQNVIRDRFNKGLSDRQVRKIRATPIGADDD